jgi:hypothetical protein
MSLPLRIYSIPLSLVMFLSLLPSPATPTRASHARLTCVMANTIPILDSRVFPPYGRLLISLPEGRAASRTFEAR